MKNKIIFNMFLAYFIILTAVLIIQLSLKKADAVEPLPSEIAIEDKLKNAVVIYIDSPIVLVDEKQFLIDEHDTTLTPVIKDGKVYIPVTLLKTAFGANVSFSSGTKQTVIRLNNKAIIFYNGENKISVIDNISEENLEIEDSAIIINDRAYIPLRVFAQIYEKEIFTYNNLIIISNIEDLFDPIEEIDTINGIIENVCFLPKVGNYENLKTLINKNKEEYFVQKDTASLIDDTQTEKYLIKSISNYNFYADSNFLEVYLKNEDLENNEEQENTEQFAFKIELLEEGLSYIDISNNSLILTYSTSDSTEQKSTTMVYDISDYSNIKRINETVTNGEFFTNIIVSGYLYTVSKLEASKINNKNNVLPNIKKYYFEDNKKIDYTENEADIKDIYYFPDINDNKYTIISSINLENGEGGKDSIFFGMGEDFIINKEYMYLLTSYNKKTNIYLFRFNLGEFEYLNRIAFNEKLQNIASIATFKEDLVTINNTTYTKELTKFD